MKTGRAFATVLALALWAVGSLAAQESPADSLTPPQAAGKQSAAAARAPEDHLSLAAYFQELASQEQLLAKSYERLARIYREKTPPPGLDADSAREMKEQFRRLAETEKKAAAAAATLAAYHGRQAEQMVQSPIAFEHTSPGDTSAFRR
jgi:hypothetical protein